MLRLPQPRACTETRTMWKYDADFVLHVFYKWKVRSSDRVCSILLCSTWTILNPADGHRPIPVGVTLLSDIAYTCHVSHIPLYIKFILLIYIYETQTSSSLRNSKSSSRLKNKALIENIQIRTSTPPSLSSHIAP